MIWEVGGEIRRLPASIETPESIHVKDEIGISIKKIKIKINGI